MKVSVSVDNLARFVRSNTRLSGQPLEEVLSNLGLHTKDEPLVLQEILSLMEAEAVYLRSMGFSRRGCRK